MATGYNNIKGIYTAVVCDCVYNHKYIYSFRLFKFTVHISPSTCLPTCVYRSLLLLFKVHGVVANKSEQRVNSCGVKNRAIATLIL